MAGFAPGAKTWGSAPSGCVVRAGQEIPFPEAGAPPNATDLLIVSHQEDETPAVLAVRCGSDTLPASSSHDLGNGWRAARFERAEPWAGSLAIVVMQGACAVTDILAVIPGTPSLHRSGPESRVLPWRSIAVAPARWTRAESRVAVRAASGPCVLLALVCGPREADSPARQSLSLGIGAAAGNGSLSVEAGAWQWLGWLSEAPPSDEEVAWVTASTSPAWTPAGSRGAKEFGVLLQRIAVIPLSPLPPE